jgi:GTPase SAR1 family protein
LLDVQQRWLPEIEKHCPNAQILVVGTKIDLREDVNVLKKLSSKDQKIITFEEATAMCDSLGKVTEKLFFFFLIAIFFLLAHPSLYRTFI